MILTVLPVAGADAGGGEGEEELGLPTSTGYTSPSW